jgi:biopolymer transport protein ExbB
MNTSLFRATFAAILALAMLSPAQPLLAQQRPAQTAAPAQPPAVAAPAATPTQPAAATQTPPIPAPVAAAPVAPAPIAADASEPSAEGNNAKSLKSTVAALHELSPWSMFMSADIIVKAVMIGRRSLRW